MKKKVIAGAVGVLGVIALTGSGSDTPKPEPVIEKQEQIVQEVEIPLSEEEVVEPEIVKETPKEKVVESAPIVKKEAPKPVVSTTTPTKEIEAEPEIIEEQEEEESIEEEPAATDRNGPYYTSSHHSAKFYYPRKCSQWKDLSEKYLRSYGTVGQLLDNYSRKIHPDC